MNGWPPKPVCTLITSSRSISSRYGSTAANGVAGFERQPDAHAERADLVEQQPRVAELDVHGAAVGAGVGEPAEQHARVVDHQVTVEEEVGVLAQRLHDRRTDREVRHVVAVHAVDVQEVGLGRDAGDVGREVREVGGEDRGRDLHAPEATSRAVAARRRRLQDEHAVGVRVGREQDRAAAVRPPRRGAAAARRRSSGRCVARPLVDAERLLVRQRAHRVHEPAAGPHRAAAAASSTRCSAARSRTSLGLHAPARVGPAAQHAEPAARRVEQHPVERCRRAPAGWRPSATIGRDRAAHADAFRGAQRRCAPARDAGRRRRRRPSPPMRSAAAVALPPGRRRDVEHAVARLRVEHGDDRLARLVLRRGPAFGEI